MPQLLGLNPSKRAKPKKLHAHPSFLCCGKVFCNLPILLCNYHLNSLDFVEGGLDVPPPQCEPCLAAGGGVFFLSQSSNLLRQNIPPFPSSADGAFLCLLLLCCCFKYRAFCSLKWPVFGYYCALFLFPAFLSCSAGHFWTLR